MPIFQIRPAPGPRSRLASPPMPKMKIACQSWFSCPNLEVWKDSPLNFARHGRRLGVSCSAATFSQKMNLSATSAEGAHFVACWPGRAPSKSLSMALLIFSKSCIRKNLPLVRSNLERKEKQSAAAKAGGPGGQKADPTVAPAAERKRKAEADTSATGHADTAASSSARADRLTRGCLVWSRIDTIPCTRTTNTQRGSKTILGAWDTAHCKSSKHSRTKGYKLRSPGCLLELESWSLWCTPWMEFLAWGLVLPWWGRRPLDLLEPQVDDDFLL